MTAGARIDAGVCGFVTNVEVSTEDGQFVRFGIESTCEKIRALAEAIEQLGPVDAYQEISPGGGSLVLAAARAVLSGCCAGCAVPVGIFKTMQVGAGLALPKDITISIAKEG
ncbi:MAG: hypothetical protein GXY33_09655 [Phycisphaerae bacterium]|nr:hypothetical protein [Phycisphaerae bacterium]